ncbi:MAG: beta-ketoacyl-ACP synthase III [Clostridiales bacterium]
MKSLKILSTGSYLPPHIITNDEFSKTLDTDDKWITSRTGIESRHFATDETNTDMAIKAAQAAFSKAAINKEDICCVIVATFTPDDFTPAIGCEVHNALNLPPNIMSFDINAACSGFIYAMEVAEGLLLQHPEKYALVIGSEKISNFLDFTDRTTCVLFGDGAGAAIMGLQNGKSCYTMGTRASRSALYCPSIANPKLAMNGKEVFKFAVEVIPQSIEEILAKAHLNIDEIDHIVCHQANLRIISHVYKKMAIEPSKFFVNLNHCGNTSGASIPLALDEMNQKALLKKGDKIICVGFGAGLTWGATLITW